MAVKRAAHADGRTYLSWVLVYTFAKVAGIQIAHLADSRTLDAVVAAGFDPWTANQGHAAERVVAARQVRAFRDRAIGE
jgi:hypothetical protein